MCLPSELNSPYSRGVGLNIPKYCSRRHSAPDSVARHSRIIERDERT
jgi:hypothetical protein